MFIFVAIAIEKRNSLVTMPQSIGKEGEFIMRNWAKLIALLCTAVLVFSCSLVAYADSCNHHYVTIDESRTRWIVSDGGHQKVIERKLYCTLCGATTYVQSGIEVPFSAHKLLVTSHWHNSGSNTHTYVQTCNVFGYSKSTTRTCYGPPCEIHLR